MKARTGLGLSAAALAWLCFSPGAFATGTPMPNNNVTYIAQTVALSTTANTAAIPPGFLSYSTAGGTTLKAGDTIVFSAPAGNNWALSGAPTCGGAALTGTVTASANNLTCTLAGAGTTTMVTVFNAAGTSPASLSGPSVALLGVPQINQPATTNPSPVVLITAQNTGVAGGGTVPDAAPIADLGLTSENLFSFANGGELLGIDLTGGGLPSIPPGGGFNVTPASGTPITTSGQPAPQVSLAGFLGTLTINVNLTGFDARNGIAVGAGDPLFTNGSLTGVASATLTGDFATITSAYLLPNNNGAPSGNQSSCAATPPSNAITGTISTGKNSITFASLGNPGSPTAASGTNQVLFAVCVVTNGTQVIQASGPIGINAKVIVGTGSSALTTGLTGATDTFGSISYLGSVFFAQNVFGVNNGSPTFFRMVNGSNTAAQVWAVLTKDVPNTSPETGAGSCNYNGTSSATLSAQPVPPNATNPPTVCNISFVANLASQPGLPDTITTNVASGGSAGMVQANNATYVTGDDIAILAGTSLNPVAGQASLHATVFLLSPNSAMRFSALTQSAAFGVLVQTP